MYTHRTPVNNGILGFLFFIGFGLLVQPPCQGINKATEAQAKHYENGYKHFSSIADLLQALGVDGAVGVFDGVDQDNITRPDAGASGWCHAGPANTATLSS